MMKREDALSYYMILWCMIVIRCCYVRDEYDIMCCVELL